VAVRSAERERVRSIASERLGAACLVWVVTLTTWAWLRSSSPEPMPTALWLVAFGLLLLASAAVGRRRWARLCIIGVATAIMVDAGVALATAAIGVAGGRVAPHEVLRVWLGSLPGGAAAGPGLLAGVAFSRAMLRHPQVRAEFHAGKLGIPNSTQRALAAVLVCLFGLVVVAYGSTHKVVRDLSDRARKPVPRTEWALREDPLARIETRLANPFRPGVVPSE